MSLKRRQILAGAAAMLCAGSASRARASLAAPRSRVLAFDNLHTGERLKVEYWADSAYVADALSRIDYVLRDFRTGDVHPIHPKLLDLLSDLQAQLGTEAAFSVISGYRSPKTNAMLRSEGHSGVAAGSLHMQGMAIDIRVPGRTLATVQQAALALRLGGVGYYPTADFVHVDIGRVRLW